MLTGKGARRQAPWVCSGCCFSACCARRLGEVLAILVDLLNPERIVIGGLAMRLGSLLLDPARSVLQREVLAPAVAHCEIIPAALCVTMGF